MPAKKTSKVEPLVGEKLLAKVAELEGLSKEDKARQCGYVTITKNGQERTNMMKFYNALMEAKGIELDESGETRRRGGRAASYRLTVQSNYNLLIGAAYTKQLGLQPGDEFEIQLGRKHIKLVKLDDEEVVEE